MLCDKTNYLLDISYLNNVFIREYDISKANINILFEKGIIDREIYKYLYNAERMVRQKYVGMLQKDDGVMKTLKSGIIEAKQKLFEANNIQDHEVLSIKNDAVFIINRKLQYTKFGLVNFINKNTYTSYYKIHHLEIYYYYNSVTKEESIEVKGISDRKIVLHEKFMLDFLKDLFYTIQVNGVEIAIRLLKDFYNQYISLSLDTGYYRNFNSDSMFHYKTIISTGFYADSINNNDIPLIDIGTNASILIELQKILVSLYFSKNK